MLLARCLGASEGGLLAHPEAAVPPAAAERFGGWLTRRLAGEPVAYLLGEREFWGRSFLVDRRVLVPRPESEHLVEAALAAALPASPLVLDLGTGSGCLAVTLALELPRAALVAVDASPAALAVAAANARRHGVTDRVRLVGGDWGHALLAERVDLVVANPPYVDPDDPGSFEPAVAAHEPAAALFAGGGGLAAVAALLRSLAAVRPGTPAAVEIGRGQEAEARRVAAEAGWLTTAVRPDLAGIPRVLVLARRGGQ